ncbi:MAG: RNA degradosome polyphosphate kinase, partial [Actinomycetales bacterium]|nr:RNA degradosome polyphosphate kinase [Actinomycetales bacterium]
GRYLEHSRVFTFANNGEPEVFIGSADMMHRNLDRRVEVLVRLTEAEHIAEIDNFFSLAMDEKTASWWMAEDGSWIRHAVGSEGLPLTDLQDTVMKEISQRRRTGVKR